MTELEVRRLTSEVRDALSSLAKVKALLEEAHAQFAEFVPEPLEVGGVALSLHAFCGGIENLFRRVAQEMGEGLPRGDTWHSQLLRNMALEIPQVRPRVIKKGNAGQTGGVSAFPVCGATRLWPRVETATDARPAG